VSHSLRVRPFPLGALIGAAALIGFSLLAVTATRMSGIGKAEQRLAPAVQSVELRFQDRADGAVVVYEVYEGRGDEAVAVVDPGTGGFVRGVLRALVRERRGQGSGDAVPFRLARHADGRLTLEDPSNGRLIDLRAFGPTNEEAFARLLANTGAGR
jgi:putative photosynthetic complex assembly protein